ncbi:MULTISPECIES: ABC transporter substrate-binding protein [Streptosporangium]|uniref:Peptide/nickel transport system substrate-binding protein n=1 Tax=Streptosporangium brasiliense TaxID=47480 RepID=A0ABT9QX31_9ACTN|nr:ABC transporter substrate-binding protein [Streptosporangium brasiliense]MDP9861201.1 peptide/nickel transport system substrate-binding protein [Streptosporangium brasiliense]
MKRNIPIAAGAALLALSVAACSGGSPQTGPTGPAGPAGTSQAAGAGFQEQHKGGTLRLQAKAGDGTLDPHINYSNGNWQVFQAMYDGLLAFKKVGGEASYDLVPDLAEAMPEVSADGRSYTFTLRKGVKFAGGAEVTVDDVVASFQRIYKVSGPTSGTFYAGIVGAAACVKKPDECTLDKGVVADRAKNTVTVNLVEPDSEFPLKLALPHAVVLPKDTPDKDQGTKPIGGTGPYTAVSYDPNKELKLVRNPDFTEWSREAQPQGYPDEIVYSYGLTAEAAVTAVQNGQADWVFDPLPADRLGEIGANYASQAHVNQLSAFWYLPLNTNLAPFDRPEARQALNWAIDRQAVVKMFGGANVAQPACTLLPPGIPGHADFCDFPEPDLAKAKDLVQRSGTAGQEVSVVVADDEVSKQIGEYVRSTLEQIGYRAKLKVISTNIHFTYIQNDKNKVQVSVSQWYADYPAASDFLHVLLSCASFRPGSDSSINISGYCDKDVDARMAEAMTLDRTDKDAANAKWGEIDRDLTKASPIIPLFTPKQVDFVSSRVGNYQFHKQFFMLISQLWVK